MIEDEQHNPLATKLLSSNDSPKSSRTNSMGSGSALQGAFADRKSIGGITDRKSRSKYTSLDGVRSRYVFR